jgi:hypothetical protein
MYYNRPNFPFSQVVVPRLSSGSQVLNLRGTRVIAQYPLLLNSVTSIGTPLTFFYHYVTLPEQEAPLGDPPYRQLPTLCPPSSAAHGH